MAEIRQVQEGDSAGEFPAMIRVIRICRNCGAKIFSDAPEGLCTGCVLEAAIGAAPDVVAGVGAPGRVANLRGDNDTAAPTNKKSNACCRAAGRIRRLRIARRDWSWRSGCSVSRATKKSKSYCRIKGHQARSVGEQSTR